MPSTVWQGRIAFGLVSIPVKLYKAASQKRVQFHNVYCPAGATAAAGSGATAAPDKSPPISKVQEFPGQAQEPPLPDRVVRVHQAFVGEDPGVPLGKDALQKAFEVEPDQYVLLSDSELDDLRAHASKNLEVAEFVRMDEIDRNYCDASYYIAPDEGGEKAYALFYRVLRDSGYVALGELIMRRREYPVAVRPGSRGLILHTLFYGDEVRVQEEFTADLSLVDDKALDLATMLVNAQRGTFDPQKLKDKFKERVLELIANKRAVPGSSAPTEEPRRAPVMDIMDALRQSLERVRKPATSEGGQRRKKDQRRAK